VPEIRETRSPATAQGRCWICSKAQLAGWVIHLTQAHHLTARGFARGTAGWRGRTRSEARSGAQKPGPLGIAPGSAARDSREWGPRMRHLTQMDNPSRGFHDRFGGDAVVSLIEAERVADSPIHRGSDRLGCRAIHGARRRSRAGVFSCRVRLVAVARSTSPTVVPARSTFRPLSQSDAAPIPSRRPLATAKPPPTRRAHADERRSSLLIQFALGHDAQPTAVYLADTTVGFPDLTRSRNPTGDQSAL